MQLKEWHKVALLIVGSFLLAFYIIGSFFAEEGNPVAPNSYLILTIGGEIPERTVDDDVMDFLGEGAFTSVQQLLSAIRKAQFDENISGIIIRPFPNTMGWAKMDDIRNALLAFKNNGKSLYAYLDAAGDREYYLASAADSIFGTATGLLFVNGFASEPEFLKGTMDKLGIEADFISYGKYKNAPDTYRRTKMSDAQREVSNNLLDHYYGVLIDSIASARELPREDVIAFVDQGFATIANGHSAGLIDSLIYYNEFKDLLKARHDDKGRFVSLGRYRNAEPDAPSFFDAQDTIAVIYGVGTIVTGGESLYSDGLITSEGMAKNIRKAADNDNVKAIILRIDSPGGSGSASDVIWKEVVAAKEKKPIIVSVSDLAASGGYYISMAADTIVAHPNSIVGSIGVYIGKFAWGGFYDKIGYNRDKVKRGKNADIFSETRKFTPEQRETMTGFVMEFYQDFISKAAEGRGMTTDAIDEIAQGRVWTGQQALELGLVDVLGDFSTAVTVAKEIADIPESDKVVLRTYPRLKSVFDRVLDGNISLKNQTRQLIPAFIGIPPAFRNTILAIPHFNPGEPLFLYLDQPIMLK